MNKTPTIEGNAEGGSMGRLVRLHVVKWKMGRIRERAREGWTAPLVWWVRETEAKQKLRDLETENQRLRDTIKQLAIPQKSQIFKQSDRLSEYRESP